MSTHNEKSSKQLVNLKSSKQLNLIQSYSDITLTMSTQRYIDIMFRYFILGTGATFTFDNSEDQYKNVKTFSQFTDVIIKHNQIPKDVSPWNIKLWKVDLSTRDNNELYLKLEKNPHININVESEYGGVKLDHNWLIANDLNNTTPEHIHVIIQPITGKKRPESLKTIKEVIKEITKDANRRPIKLPNNELEMPFQQRDFEEAIDYIKETLCSNILDCIDKSNYWCLVSGGTPGIGKTRFGRELFNQAKKDITQYGQGVFNYNQEIFKRLADIHFEYLLIDFGNEYRLQTYDNDLDAAVIIGLRIAHAFFIGKKYNMTFKEFRTKINSINIFNINIFDFDDVILECHESLDLSEQQQFFLYLHIDEFQLIDVWDKKNPQSELFHNLIHCISLFMIGYTTTFVQPFLSGTAPQAVIAQKHPSDISFHFVDCPLLNDASMIRIMDHFASKFNAKTLNCAYEWKFCRPMLKLLMDTGGLPRALERLFITCFGKNGEKGQEFFNNLDIHNFNGFFDKVKYALDSRYNISNDVKKNKKVFMKIMYHCTEGIPIDPDECLDNENPDLTVRSLECRHTILSPSTDYNLFYINMPFFFICIYNEVLHIIDPKFMFNVDEYQQEWGLFVAYHEAFRTNLAIEMGKNDMTLRELYPCADKNICFDTNVKLKKLFVCEVNEQFPEKRKLTSKSNGKQIKWKNGDIVVLNGKPAKSNIFFVRLAGDETKFLIMNQCKWDYNSKDFEGYDPIVTLFALQPYDEQETRPVIQINSKEKFNQHFGPVFSTRAIFAITREINPNFWEINRLENDHVIKNRPYIDEEQFYKETPGAKKQELDFFPFDVPGTEPYAVERIKKIGTTQDVMVEQKG